MAQTERGPTQFNVPRDNFYGEADYEIAGAERILRGPGADGVSTRPPTCWPPRSSR